MFSVFGRRLEERDWRAKGIGVGKYVSDGLMSKNSENSNQSCSREVLSTSV